MTANEPMPNGFTVCALFFGDYLPLAKRCLGSILNNLDAGLVHQLRIGLNACSDATRQYIYQRLKDCPVESLIFDSGVNRLKYPMMRQMFYGLNTQPVTTQYLMWFDDDSAIISDAGWWQTVYAKMTTADMVGAIYKLPFRGDQKKAIVAQPWYKCMSFGHPPMFRFATGGWWCARTAIIQRWDYPFKDIMHCGGDTVLGELMRQQAYRLHDFRDGVLINADDMGRESKAARRGETRPPVWQTWKPNMRVDHMHHMFLISPVDPKQTEDSILARARPASASAPAVPVRIPGL